jgi:hypothetical protein
MRSAAFPPGAQIFTGLVILVVVMMFPGAPACTGVALVALGAATLATERHGSSVTRTPLLLAHMLVYAAIYLMFVGATLDAASRRASELSTIERLDLVLSMPLMTLFVISLTADIRRSLSTEY